jgi:hypothetical protein
MGYLTEHGESEDDEDDAASDAEPAPGGAE